MYARCLVAIFVILIAVDGSLACKGYKGRLKSLQKCNSNKTIPIRNLEASLTNKCQLRLKGCFPSNKPIASVRYLTEDELGQIIVNVTSCPVTTSEPGITYESPITYEPDTSIKQKTTKAHTHPPIHTHHPSRVMHTARTLVSNATTTQQSTVKPDQCGPNAHSIDKLLKIDNIEKVLADNVIGLRLRIDPELGQAQCFLLMLDVHK